MVTVYSTPRKCSWTVAMYAQSPNIFYHLLPLKINLSINVSWGQKSVTRPDVFQYRFFFLFFIASKTCKYIDINAER